MEHGRFKVEFFLMVAIAAILAFVVYAWQSHHSIQGSGLREQIALEEKLLPDTLRVVAISSATTYFTYKEQEMGYQYDLLRLFSKKEGIPFTITVARSNEELFSLLDSAKVDLSITPFAETKEMKEHYRYVGVEALSGMVLVQRKASSQASSYVSTVGALAKRKVVVPSGTRFAQRLERLNEQLGGAIEIDTIAQDSLSSEDLMRLVAQGELDYTIADEYEALLAKTYYPQLDVSLKVGFSQKIKWIMPVDRYPALAEKIDLWATEKPSSKDYRMVYKRYFESSKDPMGGEASPTIKHKHALAYAHEHPGKLSPYDDYFKEAAEKIGWPWQLLVSIAWQESNLRPEVIGWSGARGLMGIMPSTGKSFGVTVEQLLQPKSSIEVAVKVLKAFGKSFQHISSFEDRVALTLAAYNAGLAHVFDAQRLAKKYGYLSEVWEGNISKCIRMKQDPLYYNDPVCKHGYLRGQETFNYVREVMSRYQEYKRLVE